MASLCSDGDDPAGRGYLMMWDREGMAEACPLGQEMGSGAQGKAGHL